MLWQTTSAPTSASLEGLKGYDFTQSGTKSVEVLRYLKSLFDIPQSGSKDCSKAIALLNRTSEERISEEKRAIALLRKR
ncbi:MAG: hypothetical protein N2235_18010 [Fischerella sp.]|nr:hypothetical protein [Fischerella sp.]